MHWRSLKKSELDHEFVWLSVSLLSAVMAAAWLRFGLPLPRCLFHELTGLPCLTCGGTRCVLSLVHGRIIEALRWNPGVFLGLAALAVFNAYALVVLLFRLPRLRLRPLSAHAADFVRFTVVALAALNWLYEVAR